VGSEGGMKRILRENEDPRASCLNEQQPPVGVPLIVACIAEFQVGNVQVINHPRAAHD